MTASQGGSAMRLRKTTLGFCGLLWIVSSAAAQERMPYIAKEHWTEAQKKAAAGLMESKRAPTDVTGPFIIMLRSPELMDRAQRLGEFLRYGTSLPPRLSEMVILLTSRGWTQQYEWSAHAPLGLKGGLKQDVITAIAEGRRPMGMAEDEAAAYDLCAELDRNQSVSDATYARAVKTFGEQGVVEIIGLKGYYTMLAMLMNTSRTQVPGGKPPLAAFPR
jgi:4-carboxymuconolactone decarboxylase